jgi:hypothetical protein
MRAQMLTRAFVVAGVMALAVFAGCRDEPTIVIKFEPNDLAGVARLPNSAGNSAGDAADRGPARADAGQPGGAAGAGAEKKGARECKVAADCALEPVDCCDCANGGKQQAIAKKALAQAKAARAKRCAHTMCNMMISNDPSCALKADCVAGSCTLVPKK